MTLRRQYLAGHSYVNDNRQAMKQMEDKRNDELAVLKENERIESELRAKETQLLSQEAELKEQKDDDQFALAQLSAAELVDHKASALRLVHGQELAQLPDQMKRRLPVKKRSNVVTRSTPLASNKAKAEAHSTVPRRVDLSLAMKRLTQRAQHLSAREAKRFAQLPQQEGAVRRLTKQVAAHKMELGAQKAKVVVDGKRIWRDRAGGASEAVVRLDRQKLQLAKLDEVIMRKQIQHK